MGPSSELRALSAGLDVSNQTACVQAEVAFKHLKIMSLLSLTTMNMFLCILKALRSFSQITWFRSKYREHQ